MFYIVFYSVIISNKGTTNAFIKINNETRLIIFNNSYNLNTNYIHNNTTLYGSKILTNNTLLLKNIPQRTYCSATILTPSFSCLKFVNT